MQRPLRLIPASREQKLKARLISKHFQVCRVTIEIFKGIWVQELTAPEKRAVGSAERRFIADRIPVIDDADELAFDDINCHRARQKKLCRRLQA